MNCAESKRACFMEDFALQTPKETFGSVHQHKSVPLVRLHTPSSVTTPTGTSSTFLKDVLQQVGTPSDDKLHIFSQTTSAEDLASQQGTHYGHRECTSQWDRKPERQVSASVSSDDAFRGEVLEANEFHQHRPAMQEFNDAKHSRSQHTQGSRHVGRSPCQANRDGHNWGPRPFSDQRLRPQKEQAWAQGNDIRGGLPEGKVTTLMIRNIPAQFTMWQFVDEINNQGFKGLYDYYYQPVDYQTRTQRAFAFVNFVSPDIANFFKIRFNGKRLGPFQWEDEPIIVLPALEQGLEANTVSYFTRKAERHRKEMRSRPIFPEVDFSRVAEAEARVRELFANSSMTSPMEDWGPESTSPPQQYVAWCYEQQYCSACGSLLHLRFRFCPECGERLFN